MYISPHAVPFKLNEYEASKVESFANTDTGVFTILLQSDFHREGVEKK